jgi:hypothetical protein
MNEPSLLIKTERGAAVQERLAKSGYIAQPINSSAVELTGRFFIQAPGVDLFYGVDKVAGWADPIPQLVEVISSGGSNTLIVVTAPGVVYSDLGLQQPLSPSNPTPMPLTGIVSGSGGVPPLVGGYIAGYFVASDNAGIQSGIQFSKPLWFYKKGSLEARPVVFGPQDPAYDPLRRSTLIPGNQTFGYIPTIWPRNDGANNSNGVTFAGQNAAQRNGGLGAADALGYMPWYIPSQPVPARGYIDRPYVLSGSISGTAYPGDGLAIVFASIAVEPAVNTVPYGQPPAVAGQPTVAGLIESIWCPLYFPWTTLRFSVAIYAPNWNISSGSLIGTVVADNGAGLTGTIRGHFGLFDTAVLAQQAQSVVLTL